jgi:hypothetical protein
MQNKKKEILRGSLRRLGKGGPGFATVPILGNKISTPGLPSYSPAPLKTPYSLPARFIEEIKDILLQDFLLTLLLH